MEFSFDEKYMWRALQLAKSGRGNVSPNPMVGAVIVANGKIIGEGFHRRYGEGHAEVNAVASVSAADRHLLKESTIYVTLEPCSHYGKTPPCSKLIIDNEIPNIVIGASDPFKEVSGRGIKMLRDAGRNVIVGILEKECIRLNEHFFTAHTQKRPFILLKWAESLDGYIDRERGCNETSTIFSTPATTALCHKLRSEYNAIMIGAGTARLDKPSLTVRKWCGRNPLRVVVSRSGYTPTGALALTDADTLVYTAKTLQEICSDLYSKGITSLMVEGGAELLGSFLEEGLWDKVRVEQAPVILGNGIKAPVKPQGAITETSAGKNKILEILK